MKNQKRVDWQLIGNVIGIIFVIGIIWLSFTCSVEQQKWLYRCAAATNGSVEREATGESYYTDSKGRPSSASTTWHYYVRTGHGKRIEYGQNYEMEAQ